MSLLFAVAVMQGCALAPGMDPLDIASPDSDLIAFDPVPEVRSIRNFLLHPPQRRSMEDAAPLSEPSPVNYRIGIGDVLSVMVWNHPALARQSCTDSRTNPGVRVPVRNDGTIFFPYVGVVKAAGKTAETLRRDLTRRLLPFVKTPQVSINVEVYTSQRIYVVGEVEKPGMIPITGRPLTVMEALARVGGIKPTASLGQATITGKQGQRTIDLLALLRSGDAGQNITLKSGDVLHVPSNRREKIFVLGEVRKPQSVPMVDGVATLAEVLTEAGGPDPIAADPANVYVLRGNKKRPKIFHLDMEQADSLILAEQFGLEPRDVVYVSTAPIARWNRVLNQIMPSLQTLFYVDSLTRRY